MATKPRGGGSSAGGRGRGRGGGRGGDSSDDDAQSIDSLLEDQRRPEPAAVPFGAIFMLFRVLKRGATTVSFAASDGSFVEILAAAAAAGAGWCRCGDDGRDGATEHYHFADSRQHRYGREAGYKLSNQTEIDADPIFNMWVWRPATSGAEGGQDEL